MIWPFKYSNWILLHKEVDQVTLKHDLSQAASVDDGIFGDHSVIRKGELDLISEIALGERLDTIPDSSHWNGKWSHHRYLQHELLEPSKESSLVTL